MRADFPIILDANILAESATSDLFLRLSEEPRLVSPRWTEEIWEEARRTMVVRLGWPEETTDSRIAAAIRAKVETIVTMNVKHFKAADLAPWGITAAHPGEYLKVLYDLDEGVVVSVLHKMAAVRNKTLLEMLTRLSAGVPAFTAHVASDLGQEVPAYSPQVWKS